MCSTKLIVFFVIQMVIVLATPPPFPAVKFLKLFSTSPSLSQPITFIQITDLPHEKWNELYQRAVLRLEQLANEQGHQYKLLRIDSAQEQIIAGHSYKIQGLFQNAAGEEVECKYDLWKAASDGFEEYNLYCGDNEYRWSVGHRA